ncbi:MAG: isoaspartyl peptidase/L-asparaginase, partial [Gemmatimonadota bacterium]
MSPNDPNRRHFLSTLLGGGIALPLLNPTAGHGEAVPHKATNPSLDPSRLQGQSINRPLVVTSKTNQAVREEITQTAWDIMTAGGSAMDAAEKATNVSEADPRDRTVGYGGDPNEDGFHQLDASVMNGADNNNIGAVAALENIKTPCSVARLVMDRTDHWMLVGKGALRFA